MAEKMKATTKTSFNSEAYVRAVRDVNKAKERASEATGSAGQATKTACDQHNFDKKAFTFVAGLAKKEPTQQLATLGGIIQGAEAMGMFAQADMFNDFVSTMETIIARIKGGEATKGGGSSVARLLQAAE